MGRSDVAAEQLIAYPYRSIAFHDQPCELFAVNQAGDER